jgi:hypothetical protein
MCKSSVRLIDPVISVAKKVPQASYEIKAVEIPIFFQP